MKGKARFSAGFVAGIVLGAVAGAVLKRTSKRRSVVVLLHYGSLCSRMDRGYIPNWRTPVRHSSITI